MNLSHLRKQAKNLRNLYPSLVAVCGPTITPEQARSAVGRTHGYTDPFHPALTAPDVAQQVEAFLLEYPALVACNDASVTLSRAQEAVARTHGFCSWFEATRRCNESSVGRAVSKRNAPAEVTEGVLASIGKTYVFVRDDGRGRRSEYIMEYASSDAEDVAMEVEEELFDEIGYQEDVEDDRLLSDPKFQGERMKACGVVLRGHPYLLDAWNSLAVCLFQLKRFEESLAIVKPLCDGLLSMLPDGSPRISYNHQQNRPFLRLFNCQLCLLHNLQRHREADALASQLSRLESSGRMGFRDLLTQKLRNEHY